MSTFFEKLTGARQKETSSKPVNLDLEEREPIKRAGRPTPIIREEQKTTHLKVDTEDTPRQNNQQTTEDEEGELTVDIYDKGDSIMIQSTVAGVKPEDLDVSVTNDTVTIRGKRERGEELSEKDYYYKELFWGTFSRSVILPEEVDEEAAEATLKHGLLNIHLPKKRRGVVQKLKVRVS